MNKNEIEKRISEARAKLPDESKAAAILDALLADLAEPQATTRGGGNGRPPGP